MATPMWMIRRSISIRIAQSSRATISTTPVSFVSSEPVWLFLNRGFGIRSSSRSSQEDPRSADCFFFSALVFLRGQSIFPTPRITSESSRSSIGFTSCQLSRASLEGSGPGYSAVSSTRSSRVMVASSPKNVTASNTWR